MIARPSNVECLTISRLPGKRLRAADAVDAPNQFNREVSMYLHMTIGPIVSLLAGILILVMPRLLNYIVAVCLIVIRSPRTVRQRRVSLKRAIHAD
jgi:Protein of unknown function (DUF3096)